MRGRGRSRRGSLFQAAADDAGTGAGSVASVPLKTGDVVTIAAIGNAIDQCLISVDGFADERMAVALTDQQQPAARNQRDSLFRITAQLSYSARDGLKAMQSGPPLPASQMAYERLRAEKEQEHNAAVLESKKYQGQPITYGQVVQLQHVKTSKFVTVQGKTLAEVQKECVALRLEDNGGPGSWLRIMPGFRFQPEGTVVNLNDQVKLEALSMMGCFVHCDSSGGATFREADHLCEVNVKQADETAASGWRMLSHTPCNVHDARHYLQVGQVVRVFHPEAEAFVAASCGPRHNIPEGRKRPYLMANKHTSTLHTDNRSAKQMFVVELPYSVGGGAVLWDEEYRLRHLGTGMYLAVTEMPTASSGSAFYSELVSEDDASAAPRSLFSFRAVRSTEPDDRGRVPLRASDMVLRLHHTTSSGEHLWLHNTGNCKTTASGENKTSKLLSFSELCLDQDTVQLVIVPPDELQDVEICVSAVRLCRVFIEQLAACRDEIPDETTVLSMARLIEMSHDIIIEFLGRGGDEDQVSDVLTCEGERQPVQQRVARDVKLIDTLFEVLAAPFSNQSGICKLTDMTLPKYAALQRVLRHVYKAVECTFLNDRRNEGYVAQRTLQAEDPGREGITFMRLIIDQLRSVVLGGAPCLTTLTSNNLDLLNNYINDGVIMNFVELIREQGPVSSFLNFLQGLASCQGENIVGNQELLLRVMYSHGDDQRYLRNRLELMMETAIDPRSTATSWTAKCGDGNKGGEMLARDLLDNGMRELVISWHGGDSWEPGQSQLFYSATALGLPTVQLQSMPSAFEQYISRLGGDNDKEAMARQWTPLKGVAWTLDPAALHPVLFGSPWRGIAALPEADREAFKRKQLLAEFYAAQIDMYAEMCLNRSYNCIECIEKQFSYELLVTAVSNEMLPMKLRCSFSNFLCRLYVDRFPHETIQAPTLVRVWDQIKQRTAQLATHGSLPQFALQKGNPLLSDPSPFKRHPDADKFNLLLGLFATHFDELGGRQLIYDRDATAFTNSLLQLANHLANYGFYATIVKIVELCNPMIGTLDGRADLMAPEVASSSRSSDAHLFRVKDGKAAPVTKFDDATEGGIQMVDVEDEHKTEHDVEGHVMDNGASDDSLHTRRYAPSLETNLVMKSKESMCTVLNRMSDMRTDFRVTKLLWEAKSAFKSGTTLTETKHTEDGVQQTCLTPAGRSMFKALFEGDEAKAFDLDDLSDAPLVTVCLDLLMYQNYGLFEAAFNAIQQQFCQKDDVVGALQKVSVLSKPDEVSAFTLLRKQLSMLRNDIESFETWGVANDFSPIDWDTVHQVKATLVKLRHICTIGDKSDGKEPNVDTQNLLRKMDVHTIMLRALVIPEEDEQETSGKGHLTEIKELCMKMISKFVAGNKANQSLMFESVDVLVEQLTAGLIGIEDVLHSIFQGNRDICRAVPESIMWKFADAVELQGQRPQLLSLFRVICQPQLNKRPIQKNQEKIMKILASSKYSKVMVLFNEGADELSQRTAVSVEAIRRTNGFQNLLRAATEAQQHFGRGGNAEWTEHIDPQTGRMYFFNKRTRESRWEQPSDADGDAGMSLLHTQLLYHLKLVDLLSVLTKGKSGAAEVKCQRLVRFEQCIAVLLEDNLPKEIKTCYLVFFWETFLETELTVHAKMAWHPSMWELFRDRFIPDLKAFSTKLAADVEQDPGGKKKKKKKKQSLEDEQQIEYVLHGVLPTVSCFFRAIYTWNDKGLEAEHGATVSDMQQVIRDIAKVRNAAGDFADPGMQLAWVRCAVALRVIDEPAVAPRHGGLSRAESQNNMKSSKRQAQTNGLAEQELLFDLKSALQEDPSVQDTLHTDFDSMVRTMQNVKSLTDPKDAHYQQALARHDEAALADVRKNVISFEQLMRRMIAHVSDCVNHEPLLGSIDTHIKVLNVLRHTVVLSQRAMDDEALNDSEQEARRKAWVAKQTELDMCGAGKLCVDVIGATSVDSDELVIAAFELSLALLEDGNEHVQATILDYLIEDHPNPDLFFGNLHHRLSRATKEEQDAIGQKHSQSRSTLFSASMDGDGPDMEDLEVEDMIRADLVFDFMQALCEGHNLRSQNVLRDQVSMIENSRKTHNLIQAALDYLLVSTSSSTVLRNLEEDSINKVGSTLDFVIEALQGPCPENQLMLAQGEMVDSCRSIMGCTGFKIVDSKARTKEIKALAVKCLVSLVEGRADPQHVIQRILLEKIDPQLMRTRLTEVHGEYEELLQQEVYEAGTWDEEYLDEGCDLLKLVQALEVADSELPKAMMPAKLLGDAPKRDKFTGSATEFKQALQTWERESKYAMSHSFFHKRLCSIEVFWNGSIEKVLFLKPSECTHFTDEHKNKMKINIEFGGEERLKDFVDMSEGLHTHMSHIEYLMRFGVYQYVGKNLMALKSWSYSLAVMMNTVMLISLKTGYREGSDTPVYVSQLLGPGKMDLVMQVLGTIQFITSTLVLTFLLVNRAPLVRQRLIQQRQASKLSGVKSIEALRLEAARLWRVISGVVALGVVLLTYVLIFYLRFATVPSAPAVTFAFIFVMKLLPSLRKYWEGTMTPWGFNYCIVYDVFTNGDTLFYILYYVCAILARYGKYHYFYVYHLMDVVVMSETLKNVVKAVTNPIQQLAMTTLLGVFIIYAFTVIFFYFFQGDMYNESGRNECDNMLLCFSQVLRLGLTQGGGIGDYTSFELGNGPIAENPGQYLWRTLFDLFFFIVVLVILLNVIFGIIIDQFGELRDEEVAKTNARLGACFICGIKAGTFDDHFARTQAISNGFKIHTTNEHCMWNYLFFLVYLKHKDETDYSGLETYVHKSYKSENLEWIPTNVALCLESGQEETSTVEEMIQEQSEKTREEFRYKLQELRETVVELGKEMVSQNAASQAVL